MRVTSSVCLLLLLHVRVIRAVVVNFSSLELLPSVAGVGRAVGELRNVSAASCGSECVALGECTSANYSPSERTCHLLHVRSEPDYWRLAHDNIYIAQPGRFSDSAGFWPLIDEAWNLWDLSSGVSTFNTPFVSAVAGGNATVLSFLGHKDSYVLMENQGDKLSVTSFTWAAKLYLESSGGPLFNWEYANAVCGFHGPHVWLTAQKLLFAVCDGLGIRNHIHSMVMGLWEWHDVAVSYDGVTGAVHMRVAGITVSATLPAPALPGSTSGPVLMGSRYYHSGSLMDDRSFRGRMACVRLWRSVRDLSSIDMDLPSCDIN